MRKNKKKEDTSTKEVKEEIIVKDTEVGEVLDIVADSDNPVSDGKEFEGADENE